MSFEYKVVPAPTRGLKAKGVKSSDDRFAHALESAMNELAADGWEYQRTDTLPCEEREGLLSKTTVYKNVLVFRRAKATEDATTEVILPLAAPTEALDATTPVLEHRAVDDDQRPEPRISDDPVAESESASDVDNEGQNKTA